ncbi:N-acetyltransferase GCN5 [Legionella busanensis]|uniref:N-acetyltransferase GCN5 n=1 Tax=Legionella busanensis TaxID=190655 RepID=A0A378KBA6_9GAMM|nr:GNAT family N-acetyltransferase [Legionella busanensis]STX81620.1 N-acetyltransferase GCN5 [Legionella busanensis]
MSEKIIIRQYDCNDAQDLVNIYYHTIHNINSKDYSEEQINIWAPSSSLDATGWKEKWEKIIPIVAQIGTKVVGFVEFESNGHIDCFYVHHEYQGCYIGSSLMKEIFNKANTLKLKQVFAEVNITAKPFFGSKGFKVIKKQNMNIRGVKLINFVMDNDKPHEYGRYSYE